MEKYVYDINFRKDTKRFKRQSDEYDKVKYICKCGHRVIIPESVDKIECGWCHRYVFKTKKDEDLYRIKEKLKGEK